ncbi:hypothetical protein LQZ19_05910 [Treponema primitia]|uniref:hypothetical protein n=1 Tax=Treponema primitia TaxID=88058 RepID=UPI00397EE067
MIINKWDVDVEKMMCRNLSNRITVRFTDTGSGIDGKIDNVPLPLLSSLARHQGGAAYLGRQLGEAERVFMPELVKARTA